jgi:hypothetical protein
MSTAPCRRRSRLQKGLSTPGSASGRGVRTQGSPPLSRFRSRQGCLRHRRKQVQAHRADQVRQARRSAAAQRHCAHPLHWDARALRSARLGGALNDRPSISTGNHRPWTFDRLPPTRTMRRCLRRSNDFGRPKQAAPKHKKALARAGRAHDDDVLLGADPMAARQGPHERLVDAARRLAGDLLDRDAAGDAGVLEEPVQSFVLPFGPLAIDARLARGARSRRSLRRRARHVPSRVAREGRRARERAEPVHLALVMQASCACPAVDDRLTDRIDRRFHGTNHEA